MICGDSWWKRGSNHSELLAWRVLSGLDIIMQIVDCEMSAWAVDRVVDAYDELGGLM